MMNSIRYGIGDATNPATAGDKIICHVCNDSGGWGKGFVMAISARWPAPEAEYRRWFREREQNDFALGSVQFVQVEADLWVANMVAQHRTRRENPTPIRYDALEAALDHVAGFAAGKLATAHMPRIGCGLAGGKWELVEPIIVRTLIERNIQVFVYDLA